jgi:serine/threonine protein kinase
MTQSAAHAQSVSQSDKRFADLVEELTARLQAGEAVELESYRRDHPEHAERIEQLLPALRLLADASQSRTDGLLAPTPAADSDPLAGTLGDFRLIREVGRGGMGVVYEAEQISLGRRVALKVLPFAATMDPRHLQRFQNEARAAASLEHPHIVPVYGVGCERGVHYYAMKFIDGQSLAEVIDELRIAKETHHKGTKDTKKNQDTAASSLCSLCLCGSNDFYKTIAELGIHAAEALEHAHSLGIVHRDIKPANVMIDGNGSLWITDFGLARTAADAGLTMTGDVLGTLRYMSPEQALAKHGLVDHRTDVYSLGVTLYELLTGKPAVEGKDREEILSRLTLEESQPPRSFDASIPRDLETIVLKAMAKTPSERYATARELADDLRRHLDSQPNRARRASLSQRFTKWSRRHRHFVTATFLVVFLAAIGLAVGTYLLWQEGLKTQAALDQAKEQRQAAVEQSARALAEQRHAEMNFDMAMNGVNDMLRPLYAKDRVETPQLQELRRVLTEKAIRFYQSLDNEGIDDRMVRYQTGRAYNSLSNFYDITGDRSRALEFRSKALAVYEIFTKDYQKDPSFWNQRGHTHVGLGSLFLEMNEPTKGAEQLRMATHAFEQACLLDPNDPRYPNNLATTLVNSNDPLDRSNPKAVEYARRARDLEPGFKDSWNILGAALYYAGDWKAAAEVLNTSLQLKPTALA